MPVDQARIWKKRSLLTIALSLGLVFSTGTVLAGDKVDVPGRSNVAAGIEVYSAMNFIEDEREFYGIQIVVFSYLDGQQDWKKQVLWRSGGPFLESPLLLDAVAAGNDLTITVPDGNNDVGLAGTWKLSLQGSSMIATGPKGKVFTLKKLTVK
jgi:hypothetical protein